MSEFTAPPTTPLLTERLIKLSHALLIHDLPRVLRGESKGAPQELSGRKLSYSRKLTKDDSILDWTKPAEALEREIRAFIEWPKSRTTWGSIDIVVLKAHVVDRSGVPGSLAIIGKQVVVYCGENALAIDVLKPAGKKEMTSEAFIAGYKSQIGLS